MLTGYMPAPDKSLYYRHEDIAKMTTYEVQNYKREIGIVYQDNQLIPNLSVRDNIIYPLRLYGHDPDTIETVYEHIINLIGMRHRQYGLASQLSG
jgi:ABC-type ATPase involved in cell division